MDRAQQNRSSTQAEQGFDYFCDGLHVGEERRVAFGKLLLSAGVLAVLGLAG